MSNKKTIYFDSEDHKMGVAGGLLGRRTARAKDFYDQLLDVKTVATLLKCTVTSLKVAALSGGKINGKIIPAPEMINEKGHMFFDGQKIKLIV